MERRGLRPSLKWVGGKRQLLPVLRRYCPPAPGAYFEPFVGGGAVFFDLLEQGRLDGQPITLSDGNAEARRAGLHAWQVPARRAVNSNAARRGTVAELVVSNIPPMPTAPPG